jgi:hypothetical protein
MYDTLKDDERVKRVARHSADLLGELLKLVADFMKRREPLRNRILADVSALLEGTTDVSRDALLDAIVEKTQAVFDAMGSPKVTAEKGCVGRGGGGIVASEGAVAVKGCLIVSGQTVQGGGVEAKVSY